MPGPYESEQLLMSRIRGDGGMTLEQIEKLIKKEKLRFYRSLLSTLNEGLLNGEIEYDETEYIYHRPTTSQ